MNGYGDLAAVLVSGMFFPARVQYLSKRNDAVVAYKSNERSSCLVHCLLNHHGRPNDSDSFFLINSRCCLLPPRWELKKRNKKTPRTKNTNHHIDNFRYKSRHRRESLLFSGTTARQRHKSTDSADHGHTPSLQATKKTAKLKLPILSDLPYPASDA